MSSSEQPEGEGEAFIGQAEGQLEGDVLADLQGQQNPDGEDMPAGPGMAARLRSPCPTPADRGVIGTRRGGH